MNRIYRYRLYPTRGQVAALEGQLDWACDLYNAALEQRRSAWRDERRSVRLGEQQHELTEALLGEDGAPPKLHGHNRTLRDVREWVTERRDLEVRDAPTQGTPAAAMTMGALEILDALSAYLNGDDDA